jgi:hypothetical protein
MANARTLLVAWRAPDSAWYPIGRLSHNGQYQFEYLAGAKQALEHGFALLPGFPQIDARYGAPELFPLFASRVMSARRPDYPVYMQWLRLNANADAMAQLEASGGARVADSLELFAIPSQDNGLFRSVFFLHGLRYQGAEAIAAANALSTGDPLTLVPEPGNPHDPCAHGVVTKKGERIGYVPRYLSCDIAMLQRYGPVEMTVEANNIDAPLSHRLLCRFSAPWPIGFVPMRYPEYQSLFDAAVAEASLHA